MSYARMAPESDVYVFGCGTGIDVNIAYAMADGLDLPKYRHFEYSDDVLFTVLGYLRVLQYYGVKVPEYCIARLIQEAIEGMDK